MQVGALTVVPTVTTAATTTTITVDFTVNGRVAQGGKIKIAFPAGWDMGATPTITPSAPGSLTGTGAWSAPNLVITTGGVDISEDTQVTFTVPSVVTPPEVRSGETSAVTTTTSGDGVIDGPTNAANTNIVAGTLVRWG